MDKTLKAIQEMLVEVATLRQSIERVDRNDEVDGLKRRVDRLEELVQNKDPDCEGCGDTTCKMCYPLGKATL